MEREKIRETLDELARERGAGEGDLWPRVEGQVRHRARRTRQKAAQSEWMPLPQSRGRVVRPRRAGFNLGLAGMMVALLVVFGGVALALGLMRSEVGVTVFMDEIMATPTQVVEAGQDGRVTPVSSPLSNPDWDMAAPKWRNGGYTEYLVSLANPINISKTVGPYKVTLEKGYADPHAIVLVYSIQDNGGGKSLRDLHNHKIERQGVALATPSRRTTFLSDVSANEVFGSSGDLERGSYTYALAFDASDYGALTDTLDLTFVPVLGEDQVPDSLRPAYDRGEMVPPGWVDLGLWRKSDDLFGSAALTSFDFSLPVNKKGIQVIEVNQKARGAEADITLERITVMASGVRMHIKVESPLQSDYEISPELTLQAGAGFPQQEPYMSRVTTVGDPGQAQIHTLLGPFAQYPGEWTLSANEVRAGQVARPGVDVKDMVEDDLPNIRNLRGDWTIKFNVPTAAQTTPAPTDKVAASSPPIWAGYFRHLEPLSSRLGIAKVAGPYTVILESGYADANVVIVTFSVEGMGAEQLRRFHEVGRAGHVLQDRTTGKRLEELTYGYSVLTEQIHGPDGLLASARPIYMVTFDPTALGTLPDKLDLTLEFMLPAFVESSGITGSRSESGPTNTPVVATSALIGPTVRAATYEFSLPVTKEGTRRIEVNQSVEQEGVTVSVGSVTVAQSGARAEVRMELPKGVPEGAASRYWSSIWIDTGTGVSLSNTTSTIVGMLPPAGVRVGQQNGDWTTVFFWQVADQSGEWSLGVTNIQALIGSAKRSERLPGMWEFKFIVPPVDE